MEHRQRGVESLAKATEELRGEADLGHQHQRPPALREDPLDEAQVNLGLAAARDAMQHVGAEAAEAARHRLDRRALLGQEHRTRRAQPGFG